MLFIQIVNGNFIRGMTWYFLSPLEAAKLAGEVYSVNQEDKFALDSF